MKLGYFQNDLYSLISVKMYLITKL